MVAAGLRSYFRSAAAHPLGPGSFAEVAAALDADPIGSCMVAARFESAGMDRARLGGTFWGAEAARGASAGLCFAGPNLIPIRGDRVALQSLADALRARGRRSASIIGRAEHVAPLWERLRPWWGPAREVRGDQPLMVCPDAPSMTPDPRVTLAGPADLDAYFPAAVAMFTEEVGVDPTRPDGGAGYRARVAELLGAGRAFVLRDGATVVYKAEVGCLTRRVGLIQGVWVHPAYRGRGIAAPATAAVARAIQAWGRLPSLYVNSYNAAARAAYRRVGFHQVGTFASVLF